MIIAKTELLFLLIDDDDGWKRADKLCCGESQRCSVSSSCVCALEISIIYSQVLHDCFQ